MNSQDAANTPNHSPDETNRLARVTEAECGLAQTVTDLPTGAVYEVVAHMTGVPSLEIGDTVGITYYSPYGAVVNGRLRGPGEAPAGTLHHDNGRVTLTGEDAITLQVGRSQLHLDANGVLTVDGQVIHHIGEQRMTLDSPRLELN